MVLPPLPPPQIVRYPYRCRLQRRGNQTRDSYGDRPSPLYSDHLTTDCYAWNFLSQGEPLGVEVAALIDKWKVMLPVGTDVVEDDQVAEVWDERDPHAGRIEVVAVPLNILSVSNKRTHTLCVAEEVH